MTPYFLKLLKWDKVVVMSGKSKEIISGTYSPYPELHCAMQRVDIKLLAQFFKVTIVDYIGTLEQIQRKK